MTREELIDRLAGRTWSVSAGFSCEDVLWLNDSISHDGPQMFAAVSHDLETGEWRQLDVFSISWMARDRLRGLLDDLTIFPGWTIDAPQIAFAENCDCERVSAAAPETAHARAGDSGVTSAPDEGSCDVPAVAPVRLQCGAAT